MVVGGLVFGVMAIFVAVVGIRRIVASRRRTRRR
jgi:hypothetical protein